MEKCRFQMGAPNEIGKMDVDNAIHNIQDCWRIRDAIGIETLLPKIACKWKET